MLVVGAAGAVVSVFIAAVLMVLPSQAQQQDSQFVNKTGPGVCNSTAKYVIMSKGNNSVLRPLIDVDFDGKQLTTRFTCHFIDGSSLGDTCPDKSSHGFKPDGFEKLKLIKGAYYPIYVQQQLAEEKSLKEKFTGTELYFARGHLTPNADFTNPTERKATFYYANAVPQWQKFNNGNWKAMECGLRDYAKNTSAKLQVWTGSDGVLQLPNNNNHEVNIFLRELYNDYFIPAPAYMWKVIYDKTNNKAVVIIGNNDVTNTGRKGGQVLTTQWCKDIDRCGELKWPRTLHNDKGHIACCKVNQVNLTGLPNLNLADLPNLGNLDLMTY